MGGSTRLRPAPPPPRGPRIAPSSSASASARSSARYGLDGWERTLRELGEDLGVAERARQLEEASLGKLRGALLWS